MPIRPANTRSRSTSLADVVRRERAVGRRAVRDTERAQRAAGQRVVRLAESAARRFSVSGRCPSPTSSLRASREQHVGRAFREQQHAPCRFGVRVERAHQLALGRERHFADAREPARQLLRLQPRFPRGDDERALRSDRPARSSGRPAAAPTRCSRGRRRRGRARSSMRSVAVDLAAAVLLARHRPARNRFRRSSRARSRSPPRERSSRSSSACRSCRRR